METKCVRYHHRNPYSHFILVIITITQKQNPLKQLTICIEKTVRTHAPDSMGETPDN